MGDITKITQGGTGAVSSATAKRNVDELLGGGNIVSAVKMGGAINSVTTINAGVNQSIEGAVDEIGNKYLANHDKQSTSLGAALALIVTKESNPKLFSIIANAGNTAIAGINVTKNRQMGGL